ncbi:hypothetical protein [Flammeovirga kamogawensis]|uniref:Copper resistance protein NlpE n=1 Tax=Flammeovirga kamogawensis TaxID=373891 RepID=A0ABX8H1Z1_9BACT|nr:hypothetical protein [Flammeovirga kamogawensis]MBB6463765.1 hypothetical protein [Flammeovirga kamogawensis]QWG09723.1 hypothetical protein KM029_24300 [Flammeovirga kamogawensis]TRX65236.1 hypothetical protein EO216_22190 [Flammeovirga kamogawensis]
MKNLFLLFFILFSSTLFAQQKVMEFYFNGGEFSVTECMVQMQDSDEEEHTDQARLSYTKSSNTFTVDFVDDDFKNHQEELSGLEAYVVSGEPTIIWSKKKGSTPFVKVKEIDNNLIFEWHGDKFIID